jgi:uncharacterized protein YgbK (DUF1537 family)
MLLGAIADDLTGATDLCLTLAREGMSVIQTVGVPAPEVDTGDAEAVVVALKSRTIPAAEAVALSLDAARFLRDRGARQLFFKYCSTFDSTDAGNIGPVADALMTFLGTSRTIACPAFPGNGRTVYQGHLFVGDRLLSESPMRDHPLTPMRDPDLVRVLARQTTRPVGLIAHEIVRRGAPAIAEALARLEGIAIVDAITEADLRAIGAASAELALVTGGSGVAMGLPAMLRAAEGPRRRAEVTFTAPPGRGAILAGSCSAATLRQIAHAREAGMATLAVDPVAIAAGRMTPAAAAAFALAEDRPALIHSSAAPAAVRAAQERLGRETASGIVEDFLAEVARRLAAAGVTRLIVAGGETSGAVVAALGVRAFEIGPEIAPGVPWTRSRPPGPDLALALKSGNFGGDDFFEAAWRKLP